MNRTFATREVRTARSCSSLSSGSSSESSVSAMDIRRTLSTSGMRFESQYTGEKELTLVRGPTQAREAVQALIDEVVEPDALAHPAIVDGVIAERLNAPDEVVRVAPGGKEGVDLALVRLDLERGWDEAPELTPARAVRGSEQRREPRALAGEESHFLVKFL